MTIRELVGKLRHIDRRFRVIPGPRGIFGVYVKAPRHPDANVMGLVHICGLSAPNGFCGSAPDRAFDDKFGMRYRPYLETLRLLFDKGYGKASDYTAAFGSDWRYV
jgi:hypothetical protein